MKKILVFIFIFGILVPSSVFAESGWYEAKNRFTNDWVRYANYSTWSVKYGYDTDWINEDYISSRGAGKRSLYLKNGNGTHYATWQPLGLYYSAEVRHKGNTVFYSWRK